MSLPQRTVYGRKLVLSVEPYSPELGCLATQFGGQWVVICPNGRISSRHGDDEFGARNQAQYVNLTADNMERRLWAIR